MNNLDKQGIPGTFVVTTEFKQAANVQGKALGFKPAIVWVDHPIQNRSPDELRALAVSAVSEILNQITSAQQN